MQSRVQSLRSSQQFALLTFIFMAFIMLALPAHAADAIPAVKETADTFLATARAVSIPAAIIAFICACIFAAWKHASWGWYFMIFIACVGIGAAENIVRFAFSLGQSS
jgi:hypothetical protein